MKLFLIQYKPRLATAKPTPGQPDSMENGYRGLDLVEAKQHAAPLPSPETATGSPISGGSEKCRDQGLRAAKASVSERTANRLSSLRRTYLFNPEE
jgi:hypothetical protein